MKAIIIFIACISLSISSCKKEENETQQQCKFVGDPVENINEEIDCWQCPIQCQELLPGTRYDYFYPCYNPNNEEEFAYLRFDNTEFTTTHELWVFNYCTGEQRMVHDFALSSVDWSVKDWIIFTAPNHMIYKIKSSGDSLTQLTFSGSFNRSPIWNSEGTLFYFNTQTGSDGARLIADESGNIVDTVSYVIRNWQYHNKYPYYLRLSNEIEVGYFSIDENGSEIDTVAFTTTFEDFSAPDFSPIDLAWLNENTIFWVARRKIGITNIEDGEIQLLKSGYINREYSNVSILPNRREVLLNRIDVENAENCLFDNKHRIYIYNIEDDTEHWINIPE